MILIKFIATVDNNGGVAFNGRRQSRDQFLNKYILEYIGERKLWINEYTSKLFEEKKENIIVDNDFFNKMGDEDFAFCECISLQEHESDITELLLCEWNRDYPFDVRLDINIKDNFKVRKICDIQGKSHDKITIKECRKLC